MSEKIFLTASIDVTKVASVYSGRPGCCCGCRGKHTHATGHATQDYHVVNDRTVRTIVNKVNRAIAAGEKVEDCGDHAFWERKDGDSVRVYIVYMVDQSSEYIKHDECVASGSHAQDCDDDGFCNRCGHQ